jgi:filamentous hemagglutinin family protein
MSKFSPLFNLKYFSLISFLSGIFGTIFYFASPPVTLAQISPTSDGTGTTTSIQGNHININGGSLSADGRNLFHSFQQFGLNSQQIANFLANPQIRNILGRVVGGDPSVINGLIQVTGSNANLYLMNPSGFMFGAGASLNLGGSFTATTANGIQFGENWFNALGDNTYSSLLGNPTGFAFTMDNPGIIINEGDLEVNLGQNINLIGGTVINTGNISAPQGNIIIAAIPGTNFLRISIPGNLLSLEIEIEGLEQLNSLPNDFNLPITSLPDLLTIGKSEYLEINTDNNLQLTNLDIEIPNQSGLAIASGNINATGGGVGIFGETVGVIDAEINVSGENGGGNILIGGDFQGKGIVPNANLTVVDQNSNLKADALLTGDGGNVIVWADHITRFYGNITATGGSITGDGGFVEISGKNYLDFDGGVNVSANNGLSGSILFDPRDISIIAPAGGGNNNSEVSDNQVLFGDGNNANDDFTIHNTALTALNGNILLQATRDITLASDATLNFTNQLSTETITFQANRNITINGTITTQGANLNFSADDDGNNSGTFTLNNTIATNNGNVVISGADVVLQNNALINSSAGNITLQPSTISRTIGIGTNANSDFSLNNTELRNRINSSGTLIIGRSDGNAEISINDNTSGSNNTLSLNNTNYNLTIQGGQVRLQDNLTLNTDKILTINTNGLIYIDGDVDEGINIAGNSSLIINASGSVGNSTNFLPTNVANLNVTTNNNNQFLREANSLSSINLNAGSGNITLNLTNGNLLDADSDPDIRANLASITVNGILVIILMLLTPMLIS